MSEDMIKIECPVCKNLVESHRGRTNPPTMYTCKRCGSGLWRADILGYPRFIVARAPIQPQEKFRTLGDFLEGFK
jgi:hypothetical protein